MNLFACPKCNASLTPAEGGLACAACADHYPVEDGITRFTRQSSDMGEFTREEMRGFLDAAEEAGWREVLEEKIKPIRPAVFELLTDPRRSRFIDLLGLAGSDIVLDFGCGFGGISAQLAKKCGTVVSLDSGLERLQFLNLIRKQDGIENIVPVHSSDTLSLPFADETFEIVTVVGVFEYLPLGLSQFGVPEAQRRCLAEFLRVLKPGGRMYLATKNRFGWQYLTGSADHNRLMFGPVFPRPLADLLSKMIYRRPYRIIVDSFMGYTRLLRGAGFGDLRFYWPLPGYQFPNGFENLEISDTIDDSAVWRTQYTGWRRSALSLARNIGFLKYFVPNFSIVAQKI